MHELVLIMAQGSQRRIDDTIRGYKQLLKVGPTTILARTLNLVRETSPQAEVVVIGWPQMLTTCNAGDAELRSFLAPGVNILDGLIQTGILWSDRTVVLLGDVVFSRAAMRAIFADGRQVVFAGTPLMHACGGELFALSFDASAARLIHRSLIQCPKGLEGGQLRLLMWEIMGRIGGPHDYNLDNYLVISDWTNDIDVPADLALLPELAERIAEEPTWQSDSGLKKKSGTRRDGTGSN